MRGDGSSRFLHVQLGSAFGLPMDVLCDRRIEALGVAANMGDDKRVTTPVLKDAKVLTLLHSRL